MGLNESLLAMKAYAPYHHLYAISVIICEINKMPESVPDPAKVYELLSTNNLMDVVVDMAGNCLNSAFESASAETTDAGRIFSPQNWVKAKGSLTEAGKKSPILCRWWDELHSTARKEEKRKRS